MECSLPESLDISTVLDSATHYKQWLAQEDRIQIDATSVSRVDAAGLQVLASLFLSAKKHQINIQLVQPTQVLLEAITTLGLREQIEWNCDFGEECYDKNSSCG